MLVENSVFRSLIEKRRVLLGIYRLATARVDTLAFRSLLISKGIAIIARKRLLRCAPLFLRQTVNDSLRPLA